MVDSYVGEIRLFGGKFAPFDWAVCDGRLIRISENQALYSLLGTTWGGDGRDTFALPDLRGRLPVCQGQGPGLSRHTLGEKGGSEYVTLTIAQIPAHDHTLTGTTRDATTQTPGPSRIHAKVAGATGGLAAAAYVVNKTTTERTLNAQAIALRGNGNAHNNQMPALALTYIISLRGIYPTQN
ncbi:phage tail protein [Ancylobacter lacus]|uniref:phage tail protein n=1 Tax=Ancylobacter lacus TaxID=2579970 RepID=UPI001BD03E02|nr:tail fiber protein [Ancylobacter lacus]MBS7538153.1 phage tail protein [Ancylobacter lacus]